MERPTNGRVGLTGACLGPDSIFDFYAHRQLELECKIMLSSIDAPTAMRFSEYLRLFGWTCGFEALVYLPWLLLRKNSVVRSMAILLAANLATHPLVTFAFPTAFEKLGVTAAVAVVIKELFAPVIETFVVLKYSNLSWPQSAVVAISANLFSWWAGAALAERIF